MFNARTVVLMNHSICNSAKQKGKGRETVAGGKQEQGGRLKAKVFWSKGKNQEIGITLPKKFCLIKFREVIM